VLQVEDLIGMAIPSTPGTSHEHPNWQRKISVDIEDVFGDEANELLERAVRVPPEPVTRSHSVECKEPIAAPSYLMASSLEIPGTGA
jgi:hypothetical protein